MRVGPLSLPVSNASEAVGFLLLVVVSIYVARLLPIPAKFKP